MAPFFFFAVGFSSSPFHFVFTSFGFFFIVVLPVANGVDLQPTPIGVVYFWPAVAAVMTLAVGFAAVINGEICFLFVPFFLYRVMGGLNEGVELGYVRKGLIRLGLVRLG